MPTTITTRRRTLAAATSTTTTTITSRLQQWMMMLLLACSISIVCFLPAPVHGAQDPNIYGTNVKNPNLAYSHYYLDSTYVLQDLSNFQALYVTYSNCAWSGQKSTQEERKQEEQNQNNQNNNGQNNNNNNNNNRNGNNNNNNNRNGNNNGHNRFLPEGDDKKDAGHQCGQWGGDGSDNWYKGMNECFGANVAYSLYGILKKDSGKALKNINPCSKGTFINSFFTRDGLTSFAEATNGMVDTSSISQTCTANSDGTTSTTLGCSASGKFQVDNFAGYCIGKFYSHTSDTLDTLNKELNKVNCKLIYKSDGSLDYATELLSNSGACTPRGYQKDYCPDPSHMVSRYEYNFAMSQKNGPYHSAARIATIRDVAMGLILLLTGCALLAVSVTKRMKDARSNNSSRRQRRFGFLA